MTKWKDTEIGKVPEDWNIIKIGDLFNVKNGKTNTQDAVENGIYPLFDRSEQIKSSDKFLFDSEAIIVPGEGKEFIPHYFFGKFDLHQRVYAITPKTTDMCVKFYYYWIYYFRDYLARIAVGSTVKSLRLNHLTDFPAPSLNLTEQKAIAKILSDFDSKIELNNQMNATLESMAQAIFKHWFIDFEFPNENGKPYKSSGGKMVDSELGKIPEGWETEAIDENITFLNGLALQNYPAAPEAEYLPVIKIRELRSGITIESDKANVQVPKDYVVHDGDVLFSWSGSLEIVIWGHGIGALNQHLFKVSSSKYPKWFYYYWILRYLPTYRSIAEDKATTMGHIQRSHLKNSIVCAPDKLTLNRLDKHLSDIIDKIIEIKLESRDLSEIRDSLLPKLMSGRIKVPIVVAK